MTRTPPSVTEVRAYRDKHDCGLTVAVNAVSRRWRYEYIGFLRAKVEESSTIEDCKHSMSCIVDLLEILVERGS